MLRIILLIVCTLISPISLAQSVLFTEFMSPEHVMIGDKVILQFPHPHDNLLHLANGLSFSYGELVALSGDFYGVVAKPIALGIDLTEQKLRFKQAFATLASDKNALIEAPQILALIKSEADDVANGIKQGENPSAVYARIGTDYNIKWNCLTGGLCPSDYPTVPVEIFRKIYFLKQGRYLQLALMDFDHFNAQAWDAYHAGHVLALEKALTAHEENNVLILEEAYALNAFACHFLTDAFAPGHMRIPRLELYNTVLIHTVGSLLGTFMHNEDNRDGLMVKNRRGDTWHAYGDAHYLEPKNQKNAALLDEAMQASADEIYQTFLSGHLPSNDTVYALIPNLDAFAASDRSNAAPLFYVDGHSKLVMRRLQVSNINNYAWTPFWLGTETLLELVATQGIPTAAQALLLADPTVRSLALEKSLITDKDLLHFYFSNKL